MNGERAGFTDINVSSVALGLAQARLAGVEGIEFRRGAVPDDWPDDAFDLVVCSEILYFLEAREVERTAALAHRTLGHAGLCLLVNWTGPCDLALDGDRATDLFANAADWRVVARSRAVRYRLDLLAPAPCDETKPSRKGQPKT